MSLEHTVHGYVLHGHLLGDRDRGGYQGVGLLEGRCPRGPGKILGLGVGVNILFQTLTLPLANQGILGGRGSHIFLCLSFLP